MDEKFTMPDIPKQYKEKWDNIVLNLMKYAKEAYAIITELGCASCEINREDLSVDIKTLNNRLKEQILGKEAEGEKCCCCGKLDTAKMIGDKWYCTECDEDCEEHKFQGLTVEQVERLENVIAILKDGFEYIYMRLNTEPMAPYALKNFIESKARDVKMNLVPKEQ